MLASDERYPYVSEAWHSDVTFVDNPPLGSVLKCIVTPEFGGDTMWASMYAAYEALSDKMQHLLSDLIAIHDTSRTFLRTDYEIGRNTGSLPPKLLFDRASGCAEPILRPGAKGYSSIPSSPRPSRA